MLSDVLADLGVLAVELDQDAELRRQVGARLVQVAHDVTAASELRHPAELDLLAQRRAVLIDQLADLAPVDHHVEQAGRVGGVRVDERLHQGGAELLEPVALRDEVRLALQLDEARPSRRSPAQR